MKHVFLVLASALILSSCGQHQQNGNNGSPADSVGNAANADTSTSLSDQDIANAFIYLLGRELVLKQERLDFQKDFKWNLLIHRTLGGVAWPNPNLDVAYSEAWLAVDSNACLLLDIPPITGRYYTWQMLNGWGETLLNINERTYPQHPNGKFAICLKGSSPHIPDGALRVDIPSKTARVLMRVELGNDVKEAVRLQHLFKLTSEGQPRIDSPISVPLFSGRNFPGSDMFKNAIAKMQSDSDINAGMGPIQAKTKAVEALVNSGAAGAARVDSIIKTVGVPIIFAKIKNLGIEGNEWTKPKVIGNYGDDYTVRTVVNFGGIWANNTGEVTYFTRAGIDGSATYTLTFPKGALPASNAHYFWSIIAVDETNFQVLPNPLKKYLLNKESGLKYSADGSLTLTFAPKPIPGNPVSNWLPTIPGQNYNLTFRFYGPSKAVTDGSYFPPDLVKHP